MYGIVAPIFSCCCFCVGIRKIFWAHCLLVPCMLWIRHMTSGASRYCVLFFEKLVWFLGRRKSKFSRTKEILQLELKIGANLCIYLNEETTHHWTGIGTLKIAKNTDYLLLFTTNYISNCVSNQKLEEEKVAVGCVNVQITLRWQTSIYSGSLVLREPIVCFKKAYCIANYSLINFVCFEGR